MIQANARRGSRNQSGQGLVEYAVAIMLVLIVFSVIQRSTMRGIGKLWTTLAKDIAAPCPVGQNGEGCTPPEQIR